MAMDNKELFLQELQSILDEYERLKNAPVIEPPPDDTPSHQDFYPQLQWKPRILPRSKTVYRTVAQVRQELPERLEEYLLASYETPSLLLVQVEAGVGKSHAGVNKLQEWAKRGVKGLWLGQAHRMFESLSIYPQFDASLWQHWQGISEDTCDFNPAMQQWMQKGYPSIRLCISLCHANGHMANGCAYRRQIHAPQPIVFGMHQHAVFGLPKDGYQVAIIDENPMSSFIQERLIPPKGILSDGNGLKSAETLFQKLYDLTQTGKEYRTRKLLDEIAVDLGRVFTDIKNVASMKIELPIVYQSADVDTIPYWFLKDLLLPLMRELKCYDTKEWEGKEWASRVWVDSLGLHILQGANEWGGLPDKLIVFDATAEAQLYHEIFPDRLIEVYSPAIKRQGKIIAVVSKLNGKGTIKNKDGDFSINTTEIIHASQELINMGGFKRAGIVCHKDMRAAFEAVYGESNVLHYYNQRGTNALESCDVLFVVGTPSPNGDSIARAAIALSRDRMEAFNAHRYVQTERYYNLTSEGASLLGHAGEIPYRLLRDYDDALLKTLNHQGREMEILQALHRGRLVTNNVTVYLFTPAIDDKLEIDEIYNVPPLAPEGIGWQNWIKLKRWLPEKAAVGESVGRKEIAEFLGVKETTIAARNWLGLIQSRMLDERGTPLWAFEDDPNYQGKRGRKVQRLKPIEY